MLALDHPNLVRMIAVCVQQAPWLCILEYLPYVVHPCQPSAAPQPSADASTFRRPLSIEH